MVTNLRDAKAQLSKLVQKAAAGEEVVITVRGNAVARLTAVSPTPDLETSREDWIAELWKNAEAAAVAPMKNTTQEFWDELREERF